MFDIDEILHTEIEEIGDVNYTSIPAGEYKAFISELKTRTIVTNDGPVGLLELVFRIREPIGDEEIDLSVYGDSPTAKMGLFLDTETDSAGKTTISRGTNKNIKLWSVVKACGLDQTGKPFSISSLENEGPLQVMVKHRPDKNDPEKVYAEVVRVKALD